MEQKIKRAILCLYAIAGIEAFSLLYSIYWNFQLMKIPETDLGVKFSTFDILGFSVISSVAILIAAYKVIDGLKTKKSWAWVGGLAICLVSSPGFALPAAVYGLILLLDEDIRNHFMKELETKIKI